VAPSRLLDHAIDDAVDPIACRQGSLVDVLELGRVESVLAEFLTGDMVSPAGRESPAIPVDRGRHRDNAVEVAPESLCHFMTFTAAIGAADVVVHPVLLPVIDPCDASAPHIGMMLTTPTVIHDATVVDGAMAKQGH